jgi:ABC-type glycerol-3-phosphate transport system substrate-binding protein
VVFNKVLNLQNIKNGIYGPDSDKYRELYENLNKIIPKYVPNDYFALGYRECSDRFLSGECAIYLDAIWYIPIFADEQEKNPELFDMGWFWSPPMEGENVGSTTVRSLGGPNGFIGVVNKSQAQNDLSMDFLMFYASPQGQTIRFQAMLENNVQPQGLPLVKNVTLPEKWAPMFEGIENHGECDLNPVANFLVGVDAVKRSIRDSADLMQQFFRKEITVDELSKKQYQVVIDNIPDAVKLNKWREDALLDPSKDPFSN